MGDPPRCFAISITPFTSTGAVDEAGLRRHLRRLADSGVGVYVGGGGSGEGYVLSDAEMRTVLEAAASELGANVRAMGVEPRTAKAMIGFLDVAAEAGVGAAQVYSLDVGHGHHPTEGELTEYFSAVLSSTSLPCVISSHQSVGYRIPVRLLASLAERFPHVVGVNCSQPDLAYLAGVIDAVSGSGCAVHVGGPGQALSCLALGGRGFLSSEANLAPALCASVGQAFDAGDASVMTARAGQVIRLSNLLYGHGGIRVTKAALKRLGLGGGLPRPPRLPVSVDVVDEVMAAVAALGIRNCPLDDDGSAGLASSRHQRTLRRRATSSRSRGGVTSRTRSGRCTTRSGRRRGRRTGCLGGGLVDPQGGQTGDQSRDGDHRQLHGGGVTVGPRCHGVQGGEAERGEGEKVGLAPDVLGQTLAEQRGDFHRQQGVHAEDAPRHRVGMP